jgi:hypothetical protein
MSAYTSFSVPTDKGDRLREVARLRGKTAVSLLVEMIDAECASAGIDSRTNHVRVQRRTLANGDTFVTTLFGLGRIELPAGGILSLADGLDHAADIGGKRLDLDHDFRIQRKGAGVLLECKLFPLPGGSGVLPIKKAMSTDVAKAIAAELRAAVAVRH